MAIPAERSGSDRILRIVILAMLFLAPLALEASPAPIFFPMLLICAVTGAAALARRHSIDRSQRAPGTSVLLLIAALVACQLVPLPAPLLRLLSPGSYAFRDDISLVKIGGWHPISVSPLDTARGLAALAACILLYLGIHALFQESRWRRRLAFTVALSGFVLTLIALIQAASPHPNRLYGIWRTPFDWSVFGPYTNHSHFANFLAMAIPLALAFTVESSADLGHAWRRRHPSWLALGDAAGGRLLKWTALTMTLFVGLMASRSRGGTLAVAVGLLVFLFAYRAWRVAIGAALLVIALALAFVDVGPFLQSLVGRGTGHERFVLWIDALRLFPHFPLLGAGFNAFDKVYPRYQTVHLSMWVNAAHNEYVQILVDLGMLGAILAAGGLLILFRRAILATRRRAPLEAGLLAALAAFCFHNIFEFNWQIPANAVTFVALAGVAMARSDASVPSRRLPDSTRRNTSQGMPHASQRKA